eukprot:TRINITY_DN1153_c1_g1_i1.p1 TRINITY_DN1153_c1_g1~~TRINITY_DN1153_c1_g1_i1.p1  ORF type:complete len:204 (-),score=60.91 TRINITY_DN1153_c1_g1_i1:141-752(-)
MQMAKRRVESDLEELNEHRLPGVLTIPNDKNPFEWDVFIEGPKDTIFQDGIWKCRIIFPENYPEMPPEFRFDSDFWHPNVYDDGKVCATILHKPGKDEYEFETARERWLPIHSASTVINCVMLVLQEPGGAPANVDANRQWKNDHEGYKKRIKELGIKSQKEFKERYSHLSFDIPSEEEGDSSIDLDNLDDDDDDEDDDSDEE